MLIKKNKKGWIKIVEAFLAVLFISGVILIILNNASNRVHFQQNIDFSNEKNVLRMIQMNESARAEIVEFNLDESEESINSFPETKKILRDFFETSENIDFIAKVCKIDYECVLPSNEIQKNGLNKKNIYSNSIMISSVKEEYNPKILKIFYWRE